MHSWPRLFFTAGLFLAQDITTDFLLNGPNGEHTVTEDWLLYYIGDTACMHNNSFSIRLAS